MARAVPAKIIATKPSKHLQKSIPSMTLRIGTDGPTTRNQRRLIDQAIDQCYAEDQDDEGDKKVPEKVTQDEEGSDDDVPDLKSISSDDEGQAPYRPEPMTNFVSAPLSAIYNVEDINCTNFVMTRFAVKFAL